MTDAQHTPHTWRAQYRYQVLMATAFAAIGMPYVLLTNTTASAIMIWLHTLALWLFIPPVSVVMFMWLKPWRRVALAWDLLAQFLGLLVATGIMLTALRMVTEVSWAQLLVKPLVAALVPLYSWYILFRLYRGLQRQRTLAAHANAEAAAARWEALNARIQPHFLYNTLANLEELIAVDPPRAQSYVQKLARLFRGFLAGLDQPTGIAKDEVQLVSDYLAIQKLRFGERLSYTIDIAADAEKRLVPKNLLINLVENAVKHGGDPNHIVVEVRIADRHTILEVQNPVGEGSESSTRIGLDDLQQRLQLTDGGEFAFALEGGQARATIRLPEGKG